MNEAKTQSCFYNNVHRYINICLRELCKPFQFSFFNFHVSQNDNTTVNKFSRSQQVNLKHTFIHIYIYLCSIHKHFDSDVFLFKSHQIINQKHSMNISYMFMALPAALAMEERRYFWFILADVYHDNCFSPQMLPFIFPFPKRGVQVEYALIFQSNPFPPLLKSFNSINRTLS